MGAAFPVPDTYDLVDTYRPGKSSQGGRTELSTFEPVFDQRVSYAAHQDRIGRSKCYDPCSQIGSFADNTSVFAYCTSGKITDDDQAGMYPDAYLWADSFHS